MILKIAGIILISGGIAMAGCHKSFRIKESILIRKALYGLILHIKSRIEASSQSLTEIYSSYQNPVLEKTGFLTLLKSGHINALKYAFENTRLCISEELINIYLELAEGLGKSRSGSTEAHLLDGFISDIEKEEAKLIKNDEAKLVLYRKLGVLTGLLAALILV